MAKKNSPSNGANLGFEQKLWGIADNRGSTLMLRLIDTELRGEEAKSEIT